MSKANKLILVLLAFGLLLTGAYFLYGRLSPAAAEQLMPTPTPAITDAEPDPQEEAAPEKISAVDVPLYDAEGNEVRLADYLGEKPVIMNFWATWCPYCVMELPEFQAKYEALGDQVQFLMIDVADGSRETVSAAEAFVAEEGYTFPVLYDTTLNASYTYSATSLPITWFIDAEGYLVTAYRGALTEELLQAGIDMLLPPEG